MNGGGSRTAPTGCGEGDGDRRRLGLALANRDPCNSLTQGQGREWAELNTRLPPLVAASFFAWPKAAQALGYSE